MLQGHNILLIKILFLMRY